MIAAAAVYLLMAVIVAATLAGTAVAGTRHLNGARHDRCLANIERLEIDLGIREGPPPATLLGGFEAAVRSGGYGHALAAATLPRHVQESEQARKAQAKWARDLARYYGWDKWPK